MGKHWKCFWILSLFLAAECFAASLKTDTIKSTNGTTVVSGNARITGTLKAVTPPAGSIPDSIIGPSVNGFVAFPSASLTGGGSGPVTRENVIGFWDTPFYSQIPDLPDTFAPSPHIHDDRYYRETEVNNLLLNKLDLHAVADSAGGSARLGGQGKTYYDTVGNGGNRSRANHTGTQAISTVVGLSDSLTNHRNLINSKEPAVTGAADKVLSVQSDGTGLKTGTLVDNGSFSRSTSDFVVDYNLYVNGLTADKIVESNTSKMLVSVNKGTAYNKNFGSAAGTVSEGNHGHTGVYQPLSAGLTSLSGFGAIPGFPYYEGNGNFTKKYFGIDEGYICEANDPRLSDARTPTSHAINGAQHTGWSDWFDQAVKTTSNVTHNNLTVAGSIIGSGASYLSILMNTTDGSDNKRAVFGAGGAALASRGAFVDCYGNEHSTGHGDLKLYAGGGDGTATGAILLSPRAYFGTRPANDYRWTVAFDQYNTLYSGSTVMNLLHNLYFDGTNWRYRYGTGSNSGAALLTLGYNQFSVNVAANGNTGEIATLIPSIFCNLSGNVGIKNTNPQEALDVTGNIKASGSILSTDGNVSVSLKSFSGMGQVGVYSTGSTVNIGNSEYTPFKGSSSGGVNTTTVGDDDIIIESQIDLNKNTSVNGDLYVDEVLKVGGESRYTTLSVIGTPGGNIDVTGVSLININFAGGTRYYTLTGGAAQQRIAVVNYSGVDHYINGILLVHTKFIDFIKIGNNWAVNN